MKVSVKLFVSSTCPNCPAAKTEINELAQDRDDFNLEILDITNPNALKKAQEENIMSVPTYIIKGEGYENKIGLVSSQGHKILNEY